MQMHKYGIAAVAIVAALATPAAAGPRSHGSSHPSFGAHANFGGMNRIGSHSYGNHNFGMNRIGSNHSFSAAAVNTSGPRANFATTNSTRFSSNNIGHSDWRHHHRHRGFGFGAGFAAGALIGSSAYYDGYPYDDYAYGYGYDDGYYDDSYAAAPNYYGGGDSAAACAARYRSYDPASGTYLGYDGIRHPCP